MSTARAKGSRFEKDVCSYLADEFPGVERRVQGGSKDTGDVAGLHGWVLEAKNHNRIDLAAFVDQASREARNGNCDYFAAIIKRKYRPVEQSYVVMPLAVFRELLVELEDGKP